MAQLLLGIMELFALFTSTYGLYFLMFVLDDGLLANLHNCLWFIFGILANISGITSIICDAWDRGQRGESALRALYSLQYHYFFSWLDVLVGYGCLVTQTWMTYYPVKLSHVHIALVGIPIVAWLKRKSYAIVVTTQVVTGLAILSHLYISMVAGNWWAFFGAVLMFLQMISMSLPVRYTFFTEQFSTREASILFCGLSSLVFARGIAESVKNPRVLKRIFG